MLKILMGFALLSKLFRMFIIGTGTQLGRFFEVRNQIEISDTFLSLLIGLTLIGTMKI